MLIPRSALAEVAAALRESPGVLRVASVETDLDPLEVVRAGAGAFGASAYFAAPGGTALGGLGVAWSAEATGPGRFGVMDGALGAALPRGLEAFLGFSFAAAGPTSPGWAGFPAALLRLPQIGVVRRGGRSRLTVAVPPGASPGGVLAAAATLRSPAPATVPAVRQTRAVPPVAEWQDRVAAAVAAIEAGGPAKVVLARSLRVMLEQPAEPFDLVALARERFPGGYSYGWLSGPRALVGASPELLVSREGERFSCRPLAGSAPRGADAEADRRLGAALLASPKDRAEHAFVVEAVTAALRPLAERVEVPSVPVLDRLAGVQHLASAISGTTRARLLALVAALHPTPAVGGAPREEALAAIAAAEAFDRGWYGGGIGWVEAGGDGEVAVALRSARLCRDEAVLYAGAGIVAGSDPVAEAAETDLKLGAMLGLFGSA